MESTAHAIASLENPVTPSAQASAKCLFPEDDWGAGVRDLINTPAPYLPDDWQTSALPQKPPWEKTADECAALLVAKRKLRKGRRIKEIKQQAFKPLAAIWPVQSVIGDIDFPPQVATKKLVGALLDNIQGPTYYFKATFMRGRPGKCCNPSPEPMFPPPHRAHPAHPAYPSGHATQAYAVAYLYVHMFPDADWHELILSTARRVAKNREIAGLHYASDTEAGRELARSLVGLLAGSTKKDKDNKTFSDLMAAAKTELERFAA